MDERLQFVARRLAGEAMAELCREFGSRSRPGIRSSIAIRNAACRGSRIEVGVRIATPTNFLSKWRTLS
jgi:hypothetical protein